MNTFKRIIDSKDMEKQFTIEEMKNHHPDLVGFRDILGVKNEQE